MKKSLLLCLCLWSVGASALTFHVNGSVRALTELHGDKLLSRENDQKNLFEIHTLLRPLLQTKLFISDNLIFVSEWSFLEPKFIEFSLAQTDEVNASDTRSRFLFNTIPIKGYPFGLLQANNSSKPSVEYFRVNEMYLRWETDIVRVLIGRQPRHWGLGMVYHDGATDTLEKNAAAGDINNFKSIMDAIVFAIPFGALELQAGVIHGANAFFKDLKDDLTQFFASAHHKDEDTNMETGILIEVMLMGSSVLNSLHRSGVNTDGFETSGTLLLADAFGIFYPFEGFRIAIEAALIDGQDPLTKRDKVEKKFDSIFSFAFLVDLSYRLESAIIGVHGGFVRGDKDGTTDKRNDSFILIHPNNFAGFMFNRAAFGHLKKAVSLNNVLYPYDAKPGLANVSNGQFTIRPYAQIFFGEDWIVSLDVPIVLSHHEQDGKFAERDGSFMGVEVDLRVAYFWYDNLSLNLLLAGLFPGSYYDDKENKIDASPGYFVGLMLFSSF